MYKVKKRLVLSTDIWFESDGDFIVVSDNHYVMDEKEITRVYVAHNYSDFDRRVFSEMLRFVLFPTATVVDVLHFDWEKEIVKVLDVVVHMVRQVNYVREISIFSYNSNSKPQYRVELECVVNGRRTGVTTVLDTYEKAIKFYKRFLAEHGLEEEYRV